MRPFPKKSESHHVSNGAFTLVELLVVIAIIGILIGILVPAIQQVRESARRTTCMDHLKNLALANHNFESSYEHFPPGVACPLEYRDVEPYYDSDQWLWLAQGSPGNDGSYYGWAWFTLPYYEQNAIYDVYSSASKLTFWGGGFGLDPQTNEPLNKKEIPVHICPSDPSEDRQNKFYVDMNPTLGEPQTSGKSNYVGCLGDVGPWQRADGGLSANRYGIFGVSTRTKFGNITDGASNVILLGERATLSDTDLAGNVGTGLHASSPEMVKGAIWIGRVKHSNLPESPRAGAGYYSTLGRTGLPNGFEVNGRLYSRNIASSGHPGGAACALGDCSTHFLDENLSISVLQSLAKMADGEVVSGY